MKSQDVDKWIAELNAAGWSKHQKLPDTWVSPDGDFYRGPHRAWEIMKNIGRSLGVDISFEDEAL